MVKAVVKYFGSLRCTLHLILAMLTVFTVGFLLPQRALVGKEMYLKWQASSPVLATIDQALHLTEIYTAPVTLAIWALFFLNLLLVMKQRIPLVLKKVSSDGVKPGAQPASAFAYRIELGEQGESRLPAALAGLGYRFAGAPASFHAVKNRLSPLATLLFHLSFFLMLLGWLLVFYTRFTGFVDLSEHEPFLGQVERYNASPKLPKAGGPPDVKFRVDSVAPQVEQGVSTGITVALTDGEGQRHEVGINTPYKVGHASVLFNDLGVAPLFVVEDLSGKEIDGAYVKLNVLKGKKDAFRILGYSVMASYYPDHVLTGGEDGTRSEEFRNPAFHLEVTKDGRRLGGNTLHVGEGIEFDGLRLIFKEHSFWVRLLVTKEYGQEFIYAGFILALGALVWRLVYYRRELSGLIVEEEGRRVLQLSARADFYKALAKDEFDRVAERLTKELRD